MLSSSPPFIVKGKYVPTANCGAEQGSAQLSRLVSLIRSTVHARGPESSTAAGARPRVETTQQGRGSTDRKLRDSHAPYARQSRVKNRQKESSASCNRSLERQAVKQKGASRLVVSITSDCSDGPQIFYARRETLPTSKPKFPDNLKRYVHSITCSRMLAFL